MHQTTVEQNHGARGALGADDATGHVIAFGVIVALVTAARNELANQIVIDRPQRIAGGGEVVLGLDHTLFVAARNKHQGAVEIVDVV